MSTTTITAQRFTLNEDDARAWLQQAVKHYGQPKPGQQFPGIDNHWNPVDPGEESEVYQLVRLAVDQGVITKPSEDYDLDFVYVDDEDGGYYYFIVYVGLDLKLATRGYEMRKLGERDAIGVEAALAVLDEAVSFANTALRALADYVTKHIPAGI